ncbi:hypothetical protein KI387_031809 [Taxus chinensis]|uniref:Translocon-associated protein subunit alpha n=1 Tax=Taxus chinensis TaxID=29808 RepID=A0AA38C079_TAXCH|nr:hypothetical protein KI387_031809 [Taxus chinensis]
MQPKQFTLLAYSQPVRVALGQGMDTLKSLSRRDEIWSDVNVISVLVILIPAGGETGILVGVHNEGESSLKVHSIKASLHLPYYHGMLVQNFTVQEFVKATVPHSAQAAFPYSFTVNKYLQPGEFTLVGSMFYEIDEQLYQSVFYNATVEVVEGTGILSGETLFLVSLGLALVGLSAIWIYGQIQRISKKTKKTKKVEVGTRSADTINEWLQGTAFTQSLEKSITQSQKSKKKK